MKKSQVLLLAGMLGLLLFPGSAEAKKKRTDDESSRSARSGGVHVVQETLDLSGYGIIDENRRRDLQKRLQDLIDAHNQRIKVKRSKVKFTRVPNDSGRNISFENFNIFDIGKYGVIEESDRKILQQQLDDLIDKHNLYASGKMKRPGSVRIRK